MTFDQTVNGFIHLVLGLVDLVLGAFAFIDIWLRGVMTSLAIPNALQTAILLVIAIIFFIGAIRLLGGVLRILLIVFIVLFLLHLVTYLPGIRHVSSRAASIAPSLREAIAG